MSAKLDAGPIMLQVRVEEVDPCWSYPRVMKHLMEAAAESFWKAVDIRRAPGFTPTPFPLAEKARRFPRLEDVRRYRSILARRSGERK